MKKLYEKNETLFAVLWIVLYVVIFGTVRGNFGEASIVSAGTTAVFSLLILLFLGKNKLWSKYGLTSWPKAGKYLYYIPFALMVSVNLWFGAQLRYGIAGQLCAVVTMTLVGFLEEIIFRGFLFRGMAKDNLKSAIIVSAVTFGAGHIINLLTGHGTAETLMQMCYAIAIGFSFVLFFHKSGSLLPCILTHSLIDVTSAFCNQNLPESAAKLYDAAGAVFLLIVAGGYSLYLVKKGKE